MEMSVSNIPFTNVPGSITDRGWIFNQETSIVHRGILDYYRTVSFPNPLTESELRTVCDWLSTNKCPGWTGVRVHHGETKDKPAGTYVFCTTYDSSD